MDLAFAEASHRRSHPVPKRPGRSWLSVVLPVGCIVVLAMTFIVGLLLSGRHLAMLSEDRDVTRNLRSLQQALADAESGVRGFVLSERFDYLDPYFRALRVLNDNTVLLQRLDDEAAKPGDTNAEWNAVSHRISGVRRIWEDAVSLTTKHEAASAARMLEERGEKQLMDELRGLVGASVARRIEAIEHADAHIMLERRILLSGSLGGALFTIVALICAFRRSLREARRSEIAVADSKNATERVAQLFGMASMLQSATGREDANEVLRGTATRLLAGFGGRLYVVNSSQDRLELSTEWGADRTMPPLDHLAPTDCWAMKCGKPYINMPGAGALLCNHHSDAAAAALEIPMSARGQMLGLLVIGAGEHDATALSSIQPLAAALADAMSLALSGMMLREQLRTQALRDPLTGLYNRRFLEETLRRLGPDADRRKAPLAAIMIDLDHFKKLNDEHGHATGDAVLQAVSSTIVSLLRTTDIACRYGGEEMAVLLPDCSLAAATAKAELLRAGIAELVPAPGGATVTASFGVAAIPETTSAPAGLLASADAALYQAKQQGRNRVVQAASKMPAAQVFILDTPGLSPAA